jgi:1-acyl-sn-glycerol-3-phosphate acyltransferase
MSAKPSLVQHAVRRSVALITRLYFSKIEITGRRNLPLKPAIYAGNHPSGLM